MNSTAIDIHEEPESMSSCVPSDAQSGDPEKQTHPYYTRSKTPK